MTAYGSGCIDPHFLDLCFTPGEGAPGTHWIGGWVDLRAGLDDLEKRKFLTIPGLELRPLGRYTDYAIPAPLSFRWMDNIKIGLRQLGWDGMDWIDLDQDRDHWRALVKTVLNLRVP
jgi:hypothetical protein